MDAILSMMRQASGGDRWSGVRSIHLVMTAVADGETARAERWEDVATGRYLMHTSWPDRSSAEGFDGVSSWRQGRSGIAYTLGDVDAALVAADEAFRVARGWWFPDRHHATIAFAGTKAEDGRSYDVLEVTPEGGRVFSMWVDRASHLLFRTDEQQAEDHVVMTYANYRVVDGIMLPFLIRIGNGDTPAMDEVERVEAVDVDGVVPDSSYGIPPVPASDITLPPGRDRVEVPFHLTADDRVMVPLRINGGPELQAEFDSGGSLVVQPGSLASLRVSSAGRSRQGGNFEGTTSASNGRLATVGIGGATVRDIVFHSYAFAPDQPDKALVGLEILQRFVVGLDFDRQVMTLIRPDAFGYAGHGAAIPFHFQDNQPEIRGSIDGIAALLTIDTGDAASLDALAPFARRHDLVRRYDADIPYDGRTDGRQREVWARRRPGTVALDGADGRPIEEVHLPILRISLERSGFGADPDVSANVGLGILRQFNLTFDYVRQRIILERNRLYGRKDVFNRAGLRLRRQGSGWVVGVVYPGGPAVEAGLKQGDIVSSIDGRTTEDLGQEELAGKLIAPVGTRIRLQIHSPGGDRPIVLSLRELL